MSKSGTDGNAIESARRYQLQMAQLGEMCWRVERSLERLDNDDCWVRDIRFRAPAGDGGAWQVVVRATKDAQKVVAFGDGATFAEALRGVIARLENGSIQWKEDKYG